MQRLVLAALLVVSLALFGWTVARRVRFLLLGVREPRRRGDRLGRRLLAVLTQFLGQSKVAERQLAPAHLSWHHLLIFWGFLVITAGTAEVLAAGLFPSFRYSLLIGATAAGWLAWLVNVMNGVVLVMVAWSFVRRGLLKPRLVPLSGDAALILGAIAALMLTHLLGHAFTAVAAGAKELPHAPVSALLIGPLGSAAPATAARIAEVMAWIHVVVLLAFLNYLPYSKHIHILGALPNLFAQNLSARKLDLPKLDLEDEKSWGVGVAEQLSWKGLLDSYACTECARCSNYCPANLTGKPLSPMQIIHDVRVDLLERGPLLLEQRRTAADERAALTAKLDTLPRLAGGRVSEDSLWACTTCGACQEACPVAIEHPLKIIGMRQNLILAQEKTPADAARLFRNLERAGNPWGLTDDRMDWAEGLAVPLVDDKPDAEYLLWVGCAGAYDQRIRKQTRALVKLLGAAGVSYAVLGGEEACTGDPARRAGNEMLFQMMAETVVETVKGKKPRKIVAACPHCVHTFRHDLPQMGLELEEVVHHTQLLDRLVQGGKLRPAGPGPGTVVYHDSCYLGRWNNELHAPRRVLAALGPEGGLREASRHGMKALCCGAGGGRMFFEEKIGTRINRQRTEELLATGARTVAVACPFCSVMVGDAVKDLGKEDDVRVLDVAELLAAQIPEKAS